MSIFGKCRRWLTRALDWLLADLRAEVAALRSEVGTLRTEVATLRGIPRHKAPHRPPQEFTFALRQRREDGA